MTQVPSICCVGRGLGEETRIETNYYGTQVRGDSNLDTSEVRKSEESEKQTRCEYNSEAKQTRLTPALGWRYGPNKSTPRPLEGVTAFYGQRGL